MKTTQREKRKDQRVHTALPVFLESATGITRDVSASGVFFWTEGARAFGDVISFSVEFCRPAGRMTLKCRGDIIRTELRDTTVGLAVRITESAMHLTSAGT